MWVHGDYEICICHERVYDKGGVVRVGDGECGIVKV